MAILADMPFWAVLAILAKTAILAILAILAKPAQNRPKTGLKQAILGLFGLSGLQEAQNG